jgi:hypothetical protein
MILAALASPIPGKVSNSLALALLTEIKLAAVSVAWKLVAWESSACA